MATTKPQLAPERPDDGQVISLDKQGFIPLYYQIQQVLLEKIERGELAEGDLLDSEEELARRYQVSRMTARQALHGLKSRGVAVSQKGRGTFVRRPKLEKNIMHLQGFTVDMRQRGMTPASRLLEQTIAAPTEEQCTKLRLRPAGLDAPTKTDSFTAAGCVTRAFQMTSSTAVQLSASAIPGPNSRPVTHTCVPSPSR